MGCQCYSCRREDEARAEAAKHPEWISVKDLRMWCEENLQYVGGGGTRNVYENPYHPDWVIKIPLDRFCIDCNLKEIEIIEKETGVLLPHEGVLTPDYRIRNISVPKIRKEMIGNIPIVHMEKVRVCRGPEIDRLYDDSMAGLNDYKWAWNLNDGAQIGWTKDNRLVVYDLGYG
jgi:hypothetical protein